MTSHIRGPEHRDDLDRRPRRTLHQRLRVGGQPHTRIDQIAREGWLFENCLVTNSLCSPSRASILTGTYSHINGVSTLWTPIDASQPTFITQLRTPATRPP